MALKTVYERFLSSPSPDVLSSDVSLNYITTTTSFTGSDQVIKHLNKQEKVVKKKGDKTLSFVEAPGAIVLDVETTLEFVSGGGAYLPSLDDNFLADHVVTFPTVHIVRFNSKNQIQQVRIYWDQGSLLKQVEVIGSRGKNWPIRDGKEQVKLIANITAAQGIVTPPSREDIPIATGKIAPFAPSAGRPPSRDPSEIFGGSEAGDDSTPRARDSIISPRAGASKHFRPVRVFGEDDTEEAASVSPVKPRLGSSKSFQAVRVFDQGESGSDDLNYHPRAGANKNIQPIRVFGDDDTTPIQKELRYKTNPNKFNHYDLDNPDGKREIAQRSLGRSRPTSQWDFADFYTPEKPGNKIRGQDVRHYGWSDNEEENVETPPARPRVVQPRRDADIHFEMQDKDNGGEYQAPKRMISSFQNKGKGLYANNVYDEEGHPNPEEDVDKHTQGHVPNDVNRKKDFGSHWADSTSSMDPSENAENIRPSSSGHAKAVEMMNMSSGWDSYDESTEVKRNVPSKTTTTKLANRSSRSAYEPTWAVNDG